MAAAPLPEPSRNDGVTITSSPPSRCPICQRAFQRVGRQQVCSAACRQALWRQRHPRPRPLPLPERPARSSRTTTVYECATCEARYLGEQWCTDCQRPCRRVGPGGPCPHCDEPVALSDLLPDLESGRR